MKDSFCTKLHVPGLGATLTSFSLQVTTDAAAAPPSDWVFAGASGGIDYKVSTEEQTPGACFVEAVQHACC